MEKSTANNASRVTVSVNPHNQNLDTVHRIVGEILNRVGCGQCGRLAYLDIHTVGDPGPELGKIGVISIETQGR
jgi:hypothetical protein